MREILNKRVSQYAVCCSKRQPRMAISHFFSSQQLLSRQLCETCLCSGCVTQSNVSCKQWLGGTVPKVSKTSNSDVTLSLGHFLFKVSLENTNIKFLPSVVLTIRSSSCLLNELRQLEYFRRGTEISQYRLKTVEHLTNTRELTVAPAQLDKIATDCICKNLKNAISTNFKFAHFFFRDTSLAEF